MTDRPPASGEPQTEHEAHWGDHNEYACRLSGPHCWACNEPWPCRTSRGIEAEARATRALSTETLAEAMFNDGHGRGEHEQEYPIRDLYSNDEWAVVENIRAALVRLLAEARATPPALDVERLAAIEHDQWIAWASSIIESEPGLSPDRIRRWRSLFVPYSELSEDMKEHDRKWARIALARLAPPDDPGAGS